MAPALLLRARCRAAEAAINGAERGAPNDGESSAALRGMSEARVGVRCASVCCIIICEFVFSRLAILRVLITAPKSRGALLRGQQRHHDGHRVPSVARRRLHAATRVSPGGTQRRRREQSIGVSYNEFRRRISRRARRLLRLQLTDGNAQPWKRGALGDVNTSRSARLERRTCGEAQQ